MPTYERGKGVAPSVPMVTSCNGASSLSRLCALIVTSPTPTTTLSDPPPPEIGSWRAWYFAFDRDWLDHARARHPDKLLLRMTSQCAESSPNCHGVPPTPMGVVRVSFDLRVPLTAWRLPVNLEVPGWWSQPPTYAIFDATDFVNYHPGSAELLRDAGRVDDATEFFDLVSHSERVWEAW